MKNDRFIELLNLYVDQQLSPAEAAELERELQNDPARRRTYIQYCKMQKACVSIFENERAQAPSPRLAQALADADRKIIAFPQRRSTSFGWYAASAFAAAACVTLVVTHKSPSTGSARSTDLAATPAISTPAVSAAAQNDPSTVGRPQQFVAVKATRSTSVLASDFSTGSSGDLAASFIWMKEVQLAPIQNFSAEPIHLENRATDRSNRNDLRPNTSAPSEMAAYEFQR